MSAWPLFDLRIQTPRLELRLPKDDDLLDLAERARGNILGPDNHHHMNGWTLDQSPAYCHKFVQNHWGKRASFSPGEWDLPLGIYPVGEHKPVGVIGIYAEDFPQLRLAGTGSWLIKNYQGQGLGSEARAAALQLIFQGLGAREAHSRAVPDNQASHHISLKLGYELNGKSIIRSGDGVQPVQSYRLTRENWQSRDDIQILGLDECLPLFGLD